MADDWIDDGEFHPPTQKHNYETRIDEALANGSFPGYGPDTPGTLMFATAHDSWCDIFRDGFCNCDVLVFLVEPQTKYQLN